MAIRIYDSLSGKKEELTAPAKGPLKLFVCGPTVYDLPHLGHARVAIVFDFVKKYLKSRGLRVNYLQNITDVDDKIIARAQEERSTVKEVSRRNEKIYLATMKKLGVTGVDTYARASGHIKEIIQQIQRLTDKGFAYKTPHGVYFEVKKFPGYGKLSKQNLDELRPGWRIEPDAEKKDPLDFALWKLKKHDYEPSWKSPWGEGRPGWHIEDTAITENYFGPQYDLHGGGMDLKFPHHESEIAQQEAASGLSPFVKTWMHVGFVMVNGEKMSKSLKNFVTVDDFLKSRSANTLRFLTFQHHYRSPIDYSDEIARQAESALDGIEQFVARLPMAHGDSSAPKLDLTNYDQMFNAALDDDFNTPVAIAVLFTFINATNKNMWRLSPKNAAVIKKWLLGKLDVLGIKSEAPFIPSKIRSLAKNRDSFRNTKQFHESDAVRKEIEALGYSIEDTPAGPFLWPKKS